MSTHQLLHIQTSRPALFPAFKRFLAWAIAISVLSGVSSAQSKWIPGVEAFGGYSHLSFQSSGLGFGNETQMNGWEFALTIPHIYGGFGITGDVSGHYSTALEHYIYAVGPQYKWEVSRFQITGHGLFGKGQTRVREAGSTFVEPSDRSRAVLFGGEVDLPLNDRFTWRMVQADYVVTSAFDGTQDNLRLSTGIIVRFGKH